MKYYFFLLLLVLAACTKSDDPNNRDNSSIDKIDASLYPYLFTTGSYWIYQEENTSFYDSVWVTATPHQEFISTPVGQVEYYNISYVSSYYHLAFTEQLVGYVISRGSVNGGYMLLSDKKKGDKSLNAEILDVLDTMTVSRSVYRKVTLMKINKDAYIPDNYRYCYTDSVGVIRKELMSSTGDSVMERWNLIRYKTFLAKPL